jgi:SAM-dependent MidA family methyltransferase
MTLTDIIIQRMKDEGPISFRDFMEMALYYPELGYYSSGDDKIGKTGDFYTSSSLTPVFGAMIAKQLEEMWQILGKQQFTIVEYGAGTGLLCQDILRYLKQNEKLYDQITYVIIEKSLAMQEKQKKQLHEKVSWYDSIEDVGPINGCVLSNELLDNFSVHQVVMKDELMEVFVDYKNDFVEVLRPAGIELTNYLRELEVSLPKDFRTEINLEATRWLRQIADALQSGYILTIDYGYTSTELYRSSRSCGTILCYRGHQVNDDPYHEIGKQDITSHVNFSALCHWGEKNGLTCSGLTNQAQFLLAMGYRDYVISTAEPGKNMIQTAKKIALLNHTLLVDMGNKFKVLIQQKGISNQKQSQLQGLSNTISII